MSFVSDSVNLLLPASLAETPELSLVALEFGLESHLLLASCFGSLVGGSDRIQWKFFSRFY